MPTYMDIAYENAMTQRAQAAAQAEYYRAQAAGSSGNQALDAAKFAWQKELDKAAQTGKWNGIWNNPQQQWFTGQFGTWLGEGGEPAKGQQTLEANQQYYNQAYQNSQIYGQYYAPGSAPTAGTATQAAIAQAASTAQANAALTGYLQGASGTGNIAMDAFNTRASQADQQTYLNATGGDRGAAAERYFNDVRGAVQNAATQGGGQYTPQSMNDWVYGQGTQTLAGNEQQFTQGLRTQEEQRAAQAQQQSQTMDYLKLLSSLRGPADWAKYQQVLGSTPGGMRDLMAAAMGQYVPGGGATTGYQPQAASLQSVMGQVGGYDYTGQGGGQLGQPSVYQYNQGVYGQQPGAAQPQSSGQVWGSGIGVGQQQPTQAQQYQGYGNGTNLPAPNQISAQSWNNMAPSQQQMMLGMYENQGWDLSDVKSLYNQQLPKYATNQPTAGTWRMQ